MGNGENAKILKKLTCGVWVDPACSPQKKSWPHDLDVGYMEHSSGLEFTNTFNQGHAPSEDLQDVDMGQIVPCVSQGMGSFHPVSLWVSTTHFKPQFES